MTNGVRGSVDKRRIRRAYLGYGFAIVPKDPDKPDELIHVNSNVLLYDCPRCHALAGHLCIKDGDRQRDPHYRGMGRGNLMPFADRADRCELLLEQDRFDEIHLIESRVVLKKRRKP